MTEPGEEGAPVAGQGRRHGLVIAVKVVAFAALLWLTSLLLDPEKFRAALDSVALSTVLTFMLFMTLSRVILTARWTMIARRQLGLEEARFFFLLRTQLLAEFASIWLPSLIAGEGVRVVRLSAVTRRIKDATASIVLDRISGLVALILSSAPFLFMLFEYRDRLPFPSDLGVAAILGMGVVLVIGSVALARYRGTARLLTMTAEFVRSAPLLSLPLLVSLLGYVAVFLAYYFLLTELAGVSAREAAFIGLVARLGRFVPVSVFGFGGVEGLTYLLGELVGVATEVLVIAVALNLLVKYVLSALGVVVEVILGGRGVLRSLLGRDATAATGVPDARAR